MDNRQTESQAPLDRQQAGAGDGEHMFLYMGNPYLNHYALKEIPAKDLLLCGQTGGRIFQDLQKKLLGVSSLPGLLKILSYELGFLRAPDLTYYLGLDNKSLSVLISSLCNSGAFLKIEGPKTYYGGKYYLFNYKDAYFKDLKKRGEPSPVALAYHSPVPYKAIFHSYGTGLSKLLFYLYSEKHPEYTFYFATEYAIGNFTKAVSKQTAVISADALGVMYCTSPGNEHVQQLCLEFDTGSEEFSRLIAKIAAYHTTGYYQTERGGDTSLFFSYCCPEVEIDRNLFSNYAPGAWEASYLYILSFLYVQKVCGRVLDKEHRAECLNYDISGFFKDRKVFFNFLNSLSRLEDLELFMYLAKTTSFLPYEHVCRLGDSIIKDITSFIRNQTPDEGRKLFKCVELFLASLGCPRSRNGSFAPRERITLLDMEGFFLNPLSVNDYLRILYNMDMDHKCMIRRYGLLNAIVREMRGITRKLNRERDLSLSLGSLPESDHRLPFYPMLFGYRCYFVPTHTLTNQIPFLYWDRDSYPVRRIEDVLRAYFGEELRFLNPAKPHMVYQKDKPEDFTNAVNVKGQYNIRYELAGFLYAYRDMARSLTIYVDDLSGNLAAGLKALSCASAFTDTYDKVFILLVDDPREAVYYYERFLSPDCKNNQDLEKAYCRDFVPYEDHSPVSETDEGESLSFSEWFQMPLTHLLFCRKFLSPTFLDSLFCVSRDGKILPVTIG